MSDDAASGPSSGSVEDNAANGWFPVTVSADGSGQFRRVPFRYAWPAEMDLMARLAGLRLQHRWSDWDRSAFTAESTKHISVWVKD